jgi:hypothetical protein
MPASIPRYSEFLKWLRVENSKKGEKKELTTGQKKVRSWIKRNRGLITEIAVAYNVSPQFVHQIAYGFSTAQPGHPVEGALRERGWEPPV